MHNETVSLANRTRFMLVLNLPCDLVPECAKSTVVGTVDHDVATGQKSVRAHKKHVGGSITLLAAGDPDGGDVAHDLPRSVLKAPDVKNGLASGALALVTKPEPKAESKPAEQTQTTADASTKGGKKGAKE